MLAWTIYLSFAGAALMLLLPRDNPRAARILALLTTVGALLCGVAAALKFDPTKVLTVVQVPWIADLGIEYHLAADGISLTLVLLTGLAAVAGVLFSWNIS